MTTRGVPGQVINDDAAIPKAQTNTLGPRRTIWGAQYRVNYNKLRLEDLWIPGQLINAEQAKPRSQALHEELRSYRELRRKSNGYARMQQHIGGHLMMACHSSVG
eukprot:389329-Pelagomonas_calceolata.AAC.9